jgi:hypothetical protein
MSWIEISPTKHREARAFTKYQVDAQPLLVKPAGYVSYVPPPIPDAVPTMRSVLPDGTLGGPMKSTAPYVTPAEIARLLSHEVEAEPVPNTKLSWWQSWWRDRARNKLQRTLARIIQLSQDHEANGVKPGDHIYQHLYNKALALCHGYFDTWHLNRDHIEIEIPCMRQLRLAAYPEASAVTGSSRVFFGFLAVIVLPMVIGVWTGLFGIGQRWIMHLFGG